MLVIHGIDEGFALFLRIFRVDVFGDLGQNCLVKWASDDFLIKLLHIEVELIVQQLAVGNLSGHRVVDSHGIARLIVDALIPQFGMEVVRGVVVHQIALDNCFPIGILENRLAENLGGLEGRGSGQRDFHRVKILNYAAIFTLIVSLVPVKKFSIPHLLVQKVAPVGLVYDNQVIVVDRGHGFSIIVENTLYHSLYGGNLDTSLPLNFFVFQSLNVIDVRQGHQILQLDLFEYIQCLLSQSGAVHQKQDALETACFQETVDHAQHRPGLAGTGGHGQQSCIFPVYDGLLRCLNSPQLIIAEVQSILIPQQIKGHLLQRPIAGVDVLSQQIQKVFRTHPSPQSLRHIGGFPKIQKPDARLCSILFQIRPAIGGKGKRHFIAAPASHLVLGIVNTNITGIVFPLIVDHRGNVLVFCFCLNDTDKLQTNKKRIIGTAVISHS